MHKPKIYLAFLYLMVFIFKFCIIGYALEIYFQNPSQHILSLPIFFLFFIAGFGTFIWRIHLIEYLRPIFFTAIFSTILIGYFTKKMFAQDFIWNSINNFTSSELITTRIILLVALFFLMENFSFKLVKRLTNTAPEKIEADDILDSEL